jgi:hypothetical protein
VLRGYPQSHHVSFSIAHLTSLSMKTRMPSAFAYLIISDSVAFHEPWPSSLAMSILLASFLLSMSSLSAPIDHLLLHFLVILVRALHIFIHLSSFLEKMFFAILAEGILITRCNHCDLFPLMCIVRSWGLYSPSVKYRPPLWSSAQTSWLQTQSPWARLPALPHFLSSSGCGTGSTQPL